MGYCPRSRRQHSGLTPQHAHSVARAQVKAEEQRQASSVAQSQSLSPRLIDSMQSPRTVELVSLREEDLAELKAEPAKGADELLINRNFKFDCNDVPDRVQLLKFPLSPTMSMRTSWSSRPDPSGPATPAQVASSVFEEEETGYVMSVRGGGGVRGQEKCVYAKWVSHFALSIRFFPRGKCFGFLGGLVWPGWGPAG